jgi:hypothetical protein
MSFNEVIVKNGFLKVSVKEQRLQNILDEIAKKSGVQIISYSINDETVSTSFDYIPIDKGLQKLLSEKDHIFMYGNNDIPLLAQLKRVLIFPYSGDNSTATFIPNKKRYPEESVKGKKDISYIDLNSFSSNNEEVRKKFYEALKKIESNKGFEEIKSKVEMLESEEVIKKIQKDISDVENKIQQQTPAP